MDKQVKAIIDKALVEYADFAISLDSEPRDPDASIYADTEGWVGDMVYEIAEAISLVYSKRLG